ncbi:S26 family signal peptidase [bacterium]|nr:S26 family signal peptidase [bacterium]
MTLNSRHRSYTERLLAARKRRKTLAKALLVLLIVACARTFLAQAYTISSTSMRPALSMGDVVISFPLPVGASTIFGKLPRLTDIGRGELLVVDAAPIPTERWVFRAWDSVARFLTLQRYSPMARRYGEDAVRKGVYRVVGLPGDTLRRVGSIYEARPAGQDTFSSEFVLAGGGYSLSGTASSSAKPAFGGSGERKLGPGEYFVACDDRSVFAGSPLWGPIGQERISGRVVAVCWPPRHLGIP